MSRVKIYIEGGGEGRHHDISFRKAFTTFFKSAGLECSLPRIVRGGSRQRTLDLFSTAIDHPKTGELPLLLVDSEGPVARNTAAKVHLQKADGWTPPGEAKDEQVYLMVQVMETWFLADRRALQSFFGSSLRQSHLKEWRNLESVSKSTVLTALTQATAGCAKKYKKGKVSFELLERINPALVEQACPHAKRLLDFLRSR